MQKKALAPNVKCDMRVYNNNSNDFLIKISDNDRGHMGPEGVPNWKKTPIFFVDAKRSQIAQEFQKHKS